MSPDSLTSRFWQALRRRIDLGSAQDRPRALDVEDVNDASDLWKFLVNKGGLDTGREEYDAPIVRDIQDHLGFATDGELDEQLERSPVSVERLLAAVFEATRPYALMMNDLLEMFVEAGARTTDDNLLIDFDFGSDEVSDFEFDLEHFRAWRETWSQFQAALPVRVWNHDHLWSLEEVLRDWREGEPSDPVVRSWLSDYRDGAWPDELPGPPSTGHAGLDGSLREVWTVWKEVVEASKRYGSRRDDLRRAWREDDAADESTRWPVDLLGALESDRWPESLIVGLHNLGERLPRSPDAVSRAERVAAKLKEVLDSVPVRSEDTQASLRALRDFLQLPVWERRHELYSAWISTQITRALRDSRPRIHTYGGELRFSFSGSHLATFDAFIPRLHLFTELRSPLEDPVGKGRKNAIQPDYRLVPDPTTRLEGTLAAVEVKQHLSPDSRAFGEALTDYASGCPAARVILVNYGRLASTTLEYVDPAVRHRTEALSYVRPDRRERTKAFRARVRSAVETGGRAVSRKAGEPSLKRRVVAGGSREFAAPDARIAARVTLTWSDEPRDLDLHLFIGGGSPVSHIFWHQRGQLGGDPGMRLTDDVRDGHGPETVEIAEPPPGTCRFSVHRFSGEGTLAGSGARIEAEFPSRRLVVECPETGEGDWWDVLSWTPETGRIEIDSHVIRSSPDPFP